MTPDLEETPVMSDTNATPGGTWPDEDTVRRRHGEGGVLALRELKALGPSPLTVQIVSATIPEETPVTAAEDWRREEAR